MELWRIDVTGTTLAYGTGVSVVAGSTITPAFA
jgi:hypothetical protein